MTTFKGCSIEEVDSRDECISRFQRIRRARSWRPGDGIPLCPESAASTHLPIQPSPVHPSHPNDLLRYARGQEARKAGNVNHSTAWSMRWQDTQRFHGQVQPACEEPLALDARSLRDVLSLAAEAGYEQPQQYERGVSDLFWHGYQTYGLWQRVVRNCLRWRVDGWVDGVPPRQILRQIGAGLLLASVGTLKILISVLTSVLTPWLLLSLVSGWSALALPALIALLSVL